MYDCQNPNSSSCKLMQTSQNVQVMSEVSVILAPYKGDALFLRAKLYFTAVNWQKGNILDLVQLNLSNKQKRKGNNPNLDES